MSRSRPGDEDLLASLTAALGRPDAASDVHVHGGIGPSHHNEGFTFAYDMPTETAYCETCAAIALAFWAQRMFHLDPGQPLYRHHGARHLQRQSFSGLSHDGAGFFYANPLAAYPGVNPQGRWHDTMKDGHSSARTPWFSLPLLPAQHLAPDRQHRRVQRIRKPATAYTRRLYHDNCGRALRCRLVRR